MEVLFIELEKGIQIAQEIVSAVIKKSDRSTITVKILSLAQFQKSKEEYNPQPTKCQTNLPNMSLLPLDYMNLLQALIFVRMIPHSKSWDYTIWHDWVTDIIDTAETQWVNTAE